MLGGLTSGALTFLWLGVLSNKAMAFAAIFTPIFAVIGGLVGCFFGAIALSCGPKPRVPKSQRLRIEDRNPFEPGDGSGGEQRQDHQPDDAQRVPEPGAERDAG